MFLKQYDRWSVILFAFLSQVNLAMDVEKALPRKIRKRLLPDKETVRPNQYSGLKGLWYGVPISAEDIKTALKPKKVILRVSYDYTRLCFPKEVKFEPKILGKVHICLLTCFGVREIPHVVSEYLMPCSFVKGRWERQVWISVTYRKDPWQSSDRKSVV